MNYVSEEGLISKILGKNTYDSIAKKKQLVKNRQMT